jgi:hypothetical protein
MNISQGRNLKKTNMSKKSEREEDMYGPWVRVKREGRNSGRMQPTEDESLDVSGRTDNRG